MADQSVSSESLDSPPPCSSDSSLQMNISREGSSSRLNAQAPEFVPSRNDPNRPCLVHVFSPPNSPLTVPIQGQNHHVQYIQTPSDVDNGFLDDVALKIVNQVEYYFSDVNLATTDHLIRFIHKDPEGYVPISVVASFKKIKSFTSDHSQLAYVLRNSTKLVVSEDGTKVKRQHPLTVSDMVELQSRILIAENLPDDHCYQNLMRIFSAVGSVKTIRTCQPQTSNGGSSASRSGKVDNFLTKLHAFVEYETVELAKKAVAELNGKGNWRNCLRVRLLKQALKPNQAREKKGHQGDVNCEEGDASTSDLQPNAKQSQDPSSESHFPELEGCPNDKGGQRQGRNRGRGKGRGRPQQHNNNACVGTPPMNFGSINNEMTFVTKQQSRPRMPDGTRGFSMGRGKPIAIDIP